MRNKAQIQHHTTGYFVDPTLQKQEAPPLSLSLSLSLFCMYPYIEVVGKKVDTTYIWFENVEEPIYTTLYTQACSENSI